MLFWEYLRCCLFSSSELKFTICWQRIHRLRSSLRWIILGMVLPSVVPPSNSRIERFITVRTLNSYIFQVIRLNVISYACGFSFFSTDLTNRGPLKFEFPTCLSSIWNHVFTFAHQGLNLFVQRLKISSEHVVTLVRDICFWGNFHYRIVDRHQLAFWYVPLLKEFLFQVPLW